MSQDNNDDYWKNDEIYPKEEKAKWIDDIETACEVLIEMLCRVRVDSSVYPDKYRLEYIYLTLLGTADALQDSLKEGQSYCRNCLSLYVDGRKCAFHDYKENCKIADKPFEINFKKNGEDKFQHILNNVKLKKQIRLDSIRRSNTKYSKPKH